MTHTLFRDPMFWVGGYILIGALVATFLPVTPRAKEAFDMARHAHRHGDILVFTMITIFWPLPIAGRIVKFLKKKP